MAWAPPVFSKRSDRSLTVCDLGRRLPPAKPHEQRAWESGVPRHRTPERVRSLSDLSDRRKPSVKARTVFPDFEAHSGSMHREIGEKWTAFPPAQSISLQSDRLLGPTTKTMIRQRAADAAAEDLPLGIVYSPTAADKGRLHIPSWISFPLFAPALRFISSSIHSPHHTGSSSPAEYPSCPQPWSPIVAMSTSLC